MGQLNINKSLIVNTEASKVWEIVGPNFLHISDWGRGVNKSWENQAAVKKFNDAPAGGRHCDVTGFGKLDEEIIHYDAVKYEISWSASGEKIPSFVSNLQNVLSVKVIDENSCEIKSNITANTSGLFGFMMSPIMKMNFSKVLTGFLFDWKTYAETGSVSDIKKKELD